MLQLETVYEWYESNGGVTAGSNSRVLLVLARPSYVIHVLLPLTQYNHMIDFQWYQVIPDSGIRRSVRYLNSQSIAVP